MARIEKRRERMRVLLGRWRRSGESAAAFCRRHDMRPQKLSYWKRVLGEAGPIVKRGGGRRRAPGFVPVRLVGAGAVTSGLEIVLGSGERVVVGEGVSRELLREVLLTLRERC